MKANTTIKLMVLVALSATMFLMMAAAAFSAPPPAGNLEITKPYDIGTAKPAIESLAAPEYEMRAVDSFELEGIVEVAPDDHVSQPDEFEDLPAGSPGDEGDVGDAPDADTDEDVPATHNDQPSEEASQPPVYTRTTEGSHEDTPTYIPSRERLPFTGGPQVMYLLVGALMIAIAAGMFLLGRGKKQAQQ